MLHLNLSRLQTSNRGASEFSACELAQPNLTRRHAKNDNPGHKRAKPTGLSYASDWVAILPACSRGIASAQPPALLHNMPRLRIAQFATRRLRPAGRQRQREEPQRRAMTLQQHGVRMHRTWRRGCSRCAARRTKVQFDGVRWGRSVGGSHAPEERASCRTGDAAGRRNRAGLARHSSAAKNARARRRAAQAVEAQKPCRGSTACSSAHTASRQVKLGLQQEQIALDRLDVSARPGSVGPARGVPPPSLPSLWLRNFAGSIQFCLGPV
jgi:hypothetical protein